MKVVISANSYWNLYNFRFNLIKDISKKHKVYLLAEKDKYYKKFKKLQCNCLFIDIDSRSKSIFKNITTVFNFYLILKKIKPEYFFSFTIKPNIYGAILSKFLKFKSIPSITGLGSSLINKNFFSLILIYLYKIAVNCSYKVFFHNSHDKDFFLKNKIYHNSFKDIPGSGINLKKFNPKYKKINKFINFLMVSRLVKEKGLFEFLEAVKLIKENPKYSKNTTFTLVTIGANYLDNNIITILNNLREKKIIDFIYDAKNIIRIIRKSDCLVNPSYREGLSRSIMESMSQYKPILASNVPGCNNLVKNNYNGFLFKPRSSKSLLKALIKFIDLPSKKKVHMQINSGNFIKNFDERKVIVEYLKILNE